MERIEIPIPAKKLMRTLLDAGYQAYVVGGCVRDSLLGRKPHDWDICTNALPDQMKECFSLKDLAINGNDLIQLGYERGKSIGMMLNYLLEMVIDGIVINEKESLLEITKENLRGHK